MKPDHARALANSALPALADASSIAAVAPNDLSLATELLNVQLKLPSSDYRTPSAESWFLYDNPAIWETLNKDIVELSSNTGG